jgi:hypothetical protein
MRSLLALCTCTPEAQVGQEGIGKAHQMSVYHGRPIGAIPVLAQTQQPFGVFPNLLNEPSFFIRSDEFRSRQFRLVLD